MKDPSIYYWPCSEARASRTADELNSPKKTIVNCKKKTTYLMVRKTRKGDTRTKYRLHNDNIHRKLCMHDIFIYNINYDEIDFKFW